MLEKDDQQKGTDLREKRTTCLPFSPSPLWKPFNGTTQSPWSGTFHFLDGGDVTNHVGLLMSLETLSNESGNGDGDSKTRKKDS